MISLLLKTLVCAAQLVNLDKEDVTTQLVTSVATERFARPTVSQLPLAAHPGSWAAGDATSPFKAKAAAMERSAPVAACVALQVSYD